MQQFPSNITQNKDSLRKYCKNLRHELFLKNELEQISKAIVNNILKSDFFKNAKNIMLFYPLKEEINLLDLLRCEDKNFYFPKCEGKNLLICPNCNKFSVNKYSILEPESNPIEDLSVLDLIFVPALCADKNFYRLGYGCGYYDRFLSNKNLRAKKIVPISEKFVCQKLPSDKFDIACDILVCEKTVMQ